ncbi:hypothetical protein [Armatimonas sp.]|uniref:WD40/YVTN/BNR-like repeat-containing protein n=1 Tax=Armatimonas sp. TaxID=1872638 RepID=UPI00286D266B|nr:hypothetical protein [Armatimonas sp.]
MNPAIFAVSLLAALNSPNTPVVSGQLSNPLGGLALRNIGPTLTTGRIADVAIDPTNRSIWYVAAASGGLWKTENRGLTFTPIFDSYGSYSLATVVIDPKNPSVLWLGTGENSSQRSVGFGDGVYKSTDAGKTWQRMGLEKSEHIGKILIDPRKPDTVYVAAQGPLWSGGGERGLYKTTDGGKTWEVILTVSENTGISDIVFDPKKPDTIYASSYQRRRHTGVLIAGGPEGMIYRTDNAGKSWKKLGKGLPTVDKGRIALAVSPQKPEVVYALVTASGKEGGFFRSKNKGEQWEKMSAWGPSDAQYYGEIFTDPFTFDKIWAVDTLFTMSADGGKTFTGQRFSTHVDYHDIEFDPTDPKHLILGCDGGLYESYDGGASWRHFNNLPLSQFYRIEADNRKPFYFVYGGMQDNGTVGGPVRSLSPQGVRMSEWETVGGGDGFQARADYSNPDMLYTSSQNGSFSRQDKKTGVSTSASPRLPLTERGRWNWDTPFLISPHNPNILWMAGNRLFRSEDKGVNWKPLTGDISRNIDRNTLPVMGKVWDETAVNRHRSTTDFGVANALDESVKVKGLVYLGTDDGLIQVSEDDGKTWRKEEDFPGVPKMATVSDIAASKHDTSTVYASFHDFQHGDFKPYLLKSADRGKSWTSIAGDLPARNFVWTIAEDPKNPNLLFVGTEFGLFVTFDGGTHWLPLKNGLPTIEVRDIAIQPDWSDLVVGTFGRGGYILDDITALRALAQLEMGMPSAATLLPSRKATIYPELNYIRAAQGNINFANPWPTYFTYWLPAEVKGKLMVTVRDDKDAVVRELEAPMTAGIQRLGWDLRQPGQTRFAPGRTLTPGTYTVQLVLDEKVLSTQKLEVAAAP